MASIPRASNAAFQMAGLREYRDGWSPISPHSRESGLGWAGSRLATYGWRARRLMTNRQWAVGSGQSAVGSGQWAVRSGQFTVAYRRGLGLAAYCLLVGR